MRSSLRVPIRSIALALAVSLHASGLPPVNAQDRDSHLEAIASWVAVDAATGYERRIASGLASALGGWTADAYGNVVTTVGAGSPHRVVACALDRPSYAVSQITNDGYLRLHRIGAGSRHPLWDQQFRGAAGACADHRWSRRGRRCQVERTLRGPARRRDRARDG
jgi:hypothetical protein